MKKVILAFIMVSLTIVGCKNEEKKENTNKTVAENIKDTSFKISGMTCEMGCAKTIESKLAKKEGVIDAKVVFADSIATVKFDASKINEKEVMTFVEGIAGGNMYKTCKKTCNKSKEECATKKDSKDCSATKDAKACPPGCEKEGCNTKKTEAKGCPPGCEKKDCTAKAEKKSCKPECKKACCKKA